MKLVYVKWVDSHFRPGWASEAPEGKLMYCHSVGWLIKDDKNVKVLSANITKEDCPQRCCDITIPTRAIIQIKPLLI